MSDGTPRIYTGQKIVKENTDSRECFIECGKCGMPVRFGIAYVDPYLNDQYVHYGCLSDKRKADIQADIDKGRV